MSKKRAKKRTKIKTNREVIRTDVWDLRVDIAQKQQMILTVDEYRKFLKPLVLIINAQWVSLGGLTATERVNAVEKMIHKTKAFPDPKHSYFQLVIDRHPSHRKFPSYLRRAAIADAIGIVSSFQTPYWDWQSGIRSKRDAKPPQLTAKCSAYPSLYKGQQVKYGADFQTVDIKVWNGTDWCWISGIQIKSHGGQRHFVEGNEIQSPLLVVNRKTCQQSQCRSRLRKLTLRILIMFVVLI